MNCFSIALSGLAEVDVATLAAAVEAMPGHTWELVNGTPASLLVVDIDSVWGHMDWLRATADGQQVVAFTNDRKVRGCDLVLFKPLRVDELTALLQSVEDAASENAPSDAPAAVGKLATPQATPASVGGSHRANGTQATAPRPASAPATLRKAIIPEPEPVSEPEPTPTMTLAECLLADRVTRPMTVKGADDIELTLDPERGGYTGSSTLKPLKPLLDTPMTQVRSLDRVAIERLRQAPALPLTRLLWFAALSATPGQLAPTLDAQATYHLARWPQIEREFPRHFRIATAMMKGPGTLDDIAAAANAPVGDVADFINAYSVAGYVACDNNTDDAEEASATYGGVLSRLRRPFSRSSREEPA